MFFSWHKTPNITPTQNDKNNVSFIDEHVQHSELNGNKYCLITKIERAKSNKTCGYFIAKELYSHSVSMFLRYAMWIKLLSNKIFTSCVRLCSTYCYDCMQHNGDGSLKSIFWNYPALFSKIMVLLKFCQDVMYLKPDLRQSDNGTSQAMWQNTNCSRLFHKDCSKSILHSPTISWIQITREARHSEYLLNVNNTLQKDINLTQVPSLLLSLLLPLDSLSLLHQWPVIS